MTRRRLVSSARPRRGGPRARYEIAATAHALASSTIGGSLLGSRRRSLRPRRTHAPARPPVPARGSAAVILRGPGAGGRRAPPDDAKAPASAPFPRGDIYP